ncbi:MAG TPA: hypothetical protein VGS96_17455 [Thermoanaerobaculia bacterium]|jgi:hypothetical protein|nr:hypothetical protein [Thermoanaerobaculia bacterium]
MPMVVAENARHRDLWCIALLVAIATVFFSDVLFVGSNFYYRDLFVYHFPMKSVVREAMLSGEFPFWNRHYSAGQPLAANPAYELFYPLQWLILVGPYPFGFALHIVVHVYVALIGMYLLLRELPLGRSASMFGALSFGLGGLLHGTMTMLPTFFVWALAPIVGWSVLRVLRQPNGKRFAVAAVLAGIQLIIAEPMAILQMWMLIATGALLMVRTTGLRLARAFAALLLVGILSALIAAVQLIPAIDHARNSARSRGLPYNQVRQYAMPVARPLELAIPHLYGSFDPFTRAFWGVSAFDRGSPYLACLYNGIGVLIFALAGFVSRARGAGAVGSLAIASYVLAIGDRTPLLHALYSAGVARGIRYPEKFAALGIVAITLFAATVADRFLSGDVQTRRAVIVAGVIVVAISAIPVTWSIMPRFPESFLTFWQLSLYDLRVASIARAKWILGFCVSAAALALLLALPRLDRRPWLLLAFTLVLFDVGVVGNEIVSRLPKSYFSPPDAVTLFDPQRSTYALLHRGDWNPETQNHKNLERLLGPWFTRNALKVFSPAAWGFRSVLELDFDETALLPTHDMLDAMMRLGNSGFTPWAESFGAISNVRYIIDYRLLADVAAEGRDIEHSRPIRITRVADVGRYYFPEQVIQVRGPDDVIAFMRRSGIRRPTAFVGFAPPLPSRGNVLRIVERANSATVDVQCAADALFVATVTRHKYWRATVDGRAARLLPVNIAYQGLIVPAGKHRIEMRYRNPLVIWSAALSLATLVACGLGTIALRQPRRRLQSES